MGANASLIDAEFKRSTNFVTFAGNRPPNVADVTGNLWASYSEVAGLPIEIGGALCSTSMIVLGITLIKLT